MFKRSLSWFILVFTLLEFVAKTQLTTYDSSHGFINNNHDRYLAKEISSIQDELATDIRDVMMNNKINSKLQIKFNPEILDFKQRHLGVPHLEKVTLFNIDSNYSVDMTSISGSTVHFHSSFFENKKIPPLGNTTFNVVFLGREEGSIESNLFIHTTQGHFKYRVKGDSVFSPYRLRPIVGVKIPLNASFSPVIYFHNPFQVSIQIVEIYCSGGDFHLELPSGEVEGPKDMWEVAPFETKAIIRIRFFGETEQNHTSYVRVKLSHSDDVLVIPLEIQVGADALLYTPQGYVDFGVGGSLDGPKTVHFSLCNPFKKTVRISQIYATSKSISVEMLDQWWTISPAKEDKVRCVEVAKLVLKSKKAYELKDFYGKIIIKYKNLSRKTEVPYYVTIIEGGFKLNTSQTTFFMSSKPERPENRRISIRNDFQTPVKLLNITLPTEAKHYFQITEFSPIVLKHGEERVIFVLKLNNGVPWTHMQLNSFIELSSNITSLQFPLVSYDGKLDLKLPHRSNDNSLDLGLISVESKKDSHIMIINKNPIVIEIRQVTTSIPSGHVEVVGCGNGVYENGLLQESYANMTKCSEIKPKEYAILKLTVRSGRSETQIWGDISINTQFEQLSIPVHFKIASGKLEIGPDRLVFDQCFPSKICTHPVRIHSTFDHPMVIEDILSIPPDIRISCKHSGHIMGRATKLVGTLILDPIKLCGTECYVGIQNVETKAFWFQSFALPPTSTTDLDLNLVNILYHRYLNETLHGLTAWQNITMRLDTSEVKGHIFRTRVKMSWPSLIANETFENKSSIAFPLTQVGNITYRNITIKNPSSFDLLVQIVMDTFYPQFDVLFEGLPPVFVNYAHDTFNTKAKHGFFLEKITQTSGTESFLLAHPRSIPIRLKANDHFTVRIGFRAIDSNPNTGYLILRNNLTILEAVQLTGRGALPHFKFGNRKPGSTQPLLFEFGEKHLKECDIAIKSKSVNKPAINLKRSFTAKNNGEIPIFINSFFINDMPCEGYGFKILNCEPTILHPNATKKIDIEFTPDFTLAKVTRTLILDTSLNFPVNYTLVTTVPSFYLSVCSSAIERPEWEHNLYLITLILMAVALLIVIVLSLMDSDKICLEAALLIARQNHVQHTLDLRSIGAQTRQELQATAKPEIEPQQKGCTADSVLKQDDRNSNVGKSESEKYTAVVPSTSKTKKKNRKLCDQQERDREIHKKQWMETQKLKQEEQKQTEIETTTKKHAKKANLQPKKVEMAVKNNVIAVSTVPVPLSEEESSSTTDSSNIGEEKKLKRQLSKPIENSSPSVGEKEDVYPRNQPYREKSSGKVRQKNIPVEKTPDTEKCNAAGVEKVKPNRRERREKYSHKNQNGERFTKSNDNLSTCRISPSSFQQQQQGGSQTASPVPSGIWNESKASFSDVVARNEASTASASTVTPVTKTTSVTSKPTMYVEPYKQAFVPPSQSHPTPASPKLGPIGSRGLWSDENSLDEFGLIRNMAVESTNLFLDVDNWQERQPVPPPPNAWLPNSAWEGNSGYSTSNDHITTATSDVPYTTSYLWGSPVWTPPVPRTPPGFAPHREPTDDGNQHPNPTQQHPQNMNYNPFGYGNIWTQQQPTDPWLPRGQ